LVIALASFTDSTLPAAVAGARPEAEVLVWGIPEPRTGDRLRLNSLCGINLACFRMPGVRWVYHDPAAADAADHLVRAFTTDRTAPPLPSDPVLEERITEILATKTVGLVGRHPDGFEPCGFTDDELDTVGGAAVDSVPLETLFSAGRSVSATEVAAATAATSQAVA
ncbi:MAG: hypothetical protein GWN07_00590, partial [Actinobacteria bacterium]|nr:hypothetical protein [Actinomycetota bacterium]